MREEFINQFGHFWKTFESVINDFDNNSWNNLGYGLTKPNRIVFHILQSTKYYIQDSTPNIYKNGTSFEANTGQLKKEELPTKEDIKYLIDDLNNKTKEWLLEIDLNDKNDDFEWTGKTMGSVTLFLIRHNQYHLGEINSLLNEYQKGNAKDYFSNTL